MQRFFFDVMTLIFSCTLGFVMQRLLSKVGSTSKVGATFIIGCVISFVGVLLYYVFSCFAEWFSIDSRHLIARDCMIYLGISIVGADFCQKEPLLMRGVRFWLNLLVVLLVLLLFLCPFLGCRSSGV